MADTQRKIVKVPDVGIVAFPGEMEDAQVAAVIKSYREKKKKEPSLTTEESEHKRQLKPAQPFSTAIPKLPDWVNEPMLPKEQKWEESWNPALRAIHGKEAEARKQFDVQHPIAGGIGQGTQQFSESMTTPLNVGLALGAPESKLLSAYFAIQAMRGSFRDAQAAAQAFKEGKNADAAKYVTESLLGLGVAGMAGHHAVKDIPVPAPVKAFMANEEGSVGVPQPWEKKGIDLGDLYHGSKGKVGEVDPSKLQQRDAGLYGKGFYLSKNPEYAKTYGPKVNKVALHPEARVLDVGTIHPQFEDKVDPRLQKAIETNYRASLETAKNTAGKPDKIQGYLEMVNPTSKNFDIHEWLNQVNKYADANKYDAVKFSDGEIAVKNPSAVRIVAAPKLPEVKAQAEQVKAMKPPVVQPAPAAPVQPSAPVQAEPMPVQTPAIAKAKATLPKPTPAIPEVKPAEAKSAAAPTSPTETPEFKTWFGDWQDPHAFSSKRSPKTPQVSMAINEDGTPRVFYHGTQGDFDTFQSGRPTKNTGMMGIPYDATRAGIFFTPDATHTGDWLREWDRRGNEGVALNGNVMPVYLNIKAPLDLDNVLKGLNPLDEDARAEFEKEGINPRWFNSVHHSWELFDDADGKNFVAAAKRLGYDGATIKEEDLDGNEHDVWVAFDPEQIKSAIGNKGTYDPNFPNIEMARTAGGKLKLGADPAALGQILGSSLYKSKSAHVITKELVQNAMDAVRESTGDKDVTVELFDKMYPPKPTGKVIPNPNPDPNFKNSWVIQKPDGSYVMDENTDTPRIKAWFSNYSAEGHLNQLYPQDTGGANAIRISDTGKGMTKNELETVFTDLGASGKRESAEASGGFGLAKAAPLMMSDRLEVSTVVNENGKLMRHSFSATPQDLLGEGVDIHSEELLPDSAKTGTVITSILPKDTQLYEARSFINNANLSLRPPGNFHAFLNNRDIGGSSAKPIQKAPIATGEVPGAKFNLYTSYDKTTSPTGKYGGLTIEIHNNGIYQFSSHTDVPEGVRGLPTRVAVDVKASVPEGDKNYPFTANREELRGEVEGNIKDLVRDKIIKKIVEAHNKLIADMYWKFPMINEFIPAMDSGGRFTPEEFKEIANNPAIKEISETIFDLTSAARLLLVDNGEKDYNLGRIGQRAKRVGIVFSEDVHGVHITNPTDKSHATVFINPFDREENSPDEYASLMWHTIQHELVHDDVSGHSESFTTGFKNVSRALGSLNIRALTELRDKYADPNDSTRVRPDFDRAFQIYRESRRRAEVTPDLFGGEESRAEVGRPGGEEDRGRSLQSGGKGTVPLKPTTAYQSVDQSQPFYLKSENLINEKMKGPMPADDLHKMLLSNGVKPEEMKWTGLDEFLTSKGKGKVTPQEIQEHLAGNNLQVQEVTKGAALGAKNPNELSVEEYGKPYDQLDAYQQRYIDTITEAHDKASPHATKFGSHVLPGAEPGSYREIVLTLPENRGNAARDARIAELVTERRKGIDNLQRLKSQLEESGYGPGTDSIVNEIRTQSAQIAKAEKDAADLRRDNHDSSFRSNHWPDEVNPIGHIRFNDRTGPNGEKILHLEELQSDWHQKGRKGRYVDPQKPFGVTTSTEHFATKEEADAWADEHNLKRMFVRDERVDRPEGAVPDAPFKKNWHELMLKRMLKYAAEHGYDGVSWTPGEEQASRYDLSKQIDSIRYFPYGEGKYEVHAVKSGQIVVEKIGTPQELEEVVGKDIAKKIASGEGRDFYTGLKKNDTPSGKELVGVDLKVGGEGMKGFYDKIIPDAANKLGKQWGAKVGETKIGSSSENPYSQYEGPAFGLEDLRKIATDHTQNNHVRDEADAVVRAIRGGESYDKAIVKHGSAALAVELKGDLVAQKQTKTVPYLPITPEMRAGVKAIPYSLFSIPLAAGALSLAQIKEQADKLKKGATR